MTISSCKSEYRALNLSDFTQSFVMEIFLLVSDFNISQHFISGEKSTDGYKCRPLQ